VRQGSGFEATVLALGAVCIGGTATVLALGAVCIGGKMMWQDQTLQ
jgi:hypothetical protein